MNTETDNYEIPGKNMSSDPGDGSAPAESALEHGAEVYRKAEHAVNDAYDKTSKVVSKTYENAKSYSDENPGKTIFIALGIGLGLGLLLGANTHRSRTSRLAEPVVNALSDIALAFFR